MPKSLLIPKSLSIVSWTLVVVLSAFAAGRWSASSDLAANDSTGSTHAELTLSGAADNAAGNTSPSAVNVPSPTTATPQRNSPLTKVPSKRSYATDLQQIQQLISLAATNPQLAMEQAQQLKGAIKAQAEAAILEIWAGLDPNAAWNWVTSFQPDNNAQFIKLLEAIGRHEPRTSVTLAEKFVAEHRELRKDTYLAAVTGIAQGGAYSLAIDWVSGLEIEAETKVELKNFVVGTWAAYEPQSAMQWVMTQPEELQTAAIDRLSESWSDADPQAAVNFAASLGNKVNRESLLLPAFKKWLVLDSAAATTWLASAQLNKDFDPLISELATQPSINNGQVKAALTWAGKVHDPELRLGTVTSILSAFKQKDPASAFAYLQDIPYLSDAERTQLRGNLAFDN